MSRHSGNLRPLQIALFVCFILTTLSYHFKKNLPPRTEIKSELEKAPIQSPIHEEPFEFEYWGKSYYVQPVASYELWGLIVSHNNIHSIADIYHDRSSVDVKDLCVLWGRNIKTDLYKQLKFSSAPWTCFFYAPSRALFERFDMEGIGNNHILTDNSAVRETIRNATIGDQIYFKGWLVNYADAKTPQYLRKSSLTREDTGQGACEVVYVQEAKLLKKANAFWHNVFFWSLRGGLLLLVLIPILWIRGAYKK